jgi:subtilisin family serine protease
MKSWLVVVATAIALALCGRPAAAAEPVSALPADGRDYIVLAVDNPLHRLPQRAGSSLPYSGAPRYVEGSEASGVLSAIEREHRLQPVAAWPIAALGWHCVVYGVPQGVERDALIQALSADRRVRLVQPLQDFTTLGTVAEAPAGAGARSPVAYDDPYVDLQRGFVQTAAASAHRLSTGRGVTVAIVDTGVDLQHPELRGRVAARQDAVAPASADTAEQEAHGTAVAGVIAAAANNQQGIVGIAPGVQLNVYRACWYLPAGSGAHCNSFTLAKALAAALDSDARVVNLSLGGPSDPLLEALLRKLLEQRRVVVGALPPSGRREGFPSGVPGVLVVGIAGEQARAAGVLSAPGRDVLTPTPGGRYDFSSGSSIATAHVSGIAALLLALDPRLDGAAVQQLLEEATPPGPSASVNADTAVAALAQRIRLASAR